LASPVDTWSIGTRVIGPAECSGNRHRGKYHPGVVLDRIAAGASRTSGASDEQNMSLRVVIVDDHELLRTGTRQILSEADGMEVVAEAADAASAMEAVSETHPDIVLVDIRLPDRNGIELARMIIEQNPSTRVVILSAYDDEDYVRAAMDAGVAGYLLKTMPGDELVRAVRATASGVTVLDSAVTTNLAREHASPAPGPKDAFADLTWRERQVVDLVAEGLANKAIATRLGISARTVEGHLNHVFVKLGVVSRTELVRLALAGRDSWPRNEQDPVHPGAGKGP
jgi:DNA-binding NarL/FixJ family response regulator